MPGNKRGIPPAANSRNDTMPARLRFLVGMDTPCVILQVEEELADLSLLKQEGSISDVSIGLHSFIQRTYWSMAV